jgi:hypothetical protein
MLTTMASSGPVRPSARNERGRVRDRSCLVVHILGLCRVAWIRLWAVKAGDDPASIVVRGPLSRVGTPLMSEEGG